MYSCGTGYALALDANGGLDAVAGAMIQSMSGYETCDFNNEADCKCYSLIDYTISTLAACNIVCTCTYNANAASPGDACWPTSADDNDCDCVTSGSAACHPETYTDTMYDSCFCTYHYLPDYKQYSGLCLIPGGSSTCLLD